jgi:homeobox-leucine zipper protein
MGEKDDEFSLGLGLSLSLGCGDYANNDNQIPLKVNHMQKPPQSVPNQRVSFNNLFHTHGMCFLFSLSHLSSQIFNSIFYSF